MPRSRRNHLPDTVIHAVNRGVEKRVLFAEPRHYDDFLYLVERTLRAIPLRILGYALMPNHWHFVLWPRDAREMSQFFHRLTGAHAARIRHDTSTTGLGHLYQNRYRTVQVSTDEQYLYTLRYVEANPLRARLVERAEHWRWSSLSERLGRARLISDGPLALPSNQDWLELVNQSVVRADPSGVGTGPLRIP